MRSISFLSLLIFLVIATPSLFDAQQAHAQSGIELENAEASYRFGEQIVFVATIRSPLPLTGVSIVISDEASGITYSEPVTVEADGRTEFRFDTVQNVLRPFSVVKWNYRITLSDGSVTESEAFFMRYADDRFNWQSLESEALRVNWYAGDSDFGRAGLEAAGAGLDSISRLMTLDLEPAIEIFIYANVEDLRGTLVSGGEAWIVGHADPALGTVMVAIEPGAEQGIKMEQRIPHELMHVMMYRSFGAGYRTIPAWFREGAAILAELYPTSDYNHALADAAAGNGLIPIRDLCVAFPPDSGRAFLAYAESESFTRYLHQSYGATGLRDLAATYAGGVDCERGPELSFGVPLSSLEAEWRSSVLGRNSLQPALQPILPYLVLLCVVLMIPLLGIAVTLRRRGSRNEPETYAGKR